MSLEQRNGPCGDTGRAENLAAAKLLDLVLDSTPLTPVRTSPAPVVNVFAHGYHVVGKRGLCRLSMIVLDCPWCHQAHAHTSRPGFVTGKRKASCAGGRYVVHLATVEGEAAA